MMQDALSRKLKVLSNTVIRLFNSQSSMYGSTYVICMYPCEKSEEGEEEGRKVLRGMRAMEMTPPLKGSVSAAPHP